MKAAVLGIGTELTTGQIVNKNASWISAQLKKSGASTVMHLVVPDQRDLILESLKTCAYHADTIFVTGGLGPTSDDFTRDVITEWSQKKTFFHQPSWDHVQNRLTSRGFVVRDFQRQQCYYPEGSHVLENTHGTANGFYLQVHGKDLVILPGPPREIEAIWNTSLRPFLLEKTKGLDPLLTKSWDTIGLGESEVAFLVEKILQGHEIEKGYRVHLPYVEFKLTFLQSQQKRFQPLIRQVDAALTEFTLVKDGADLAQIASEKICQLKEFFICDSVTGPSLLSRLQPFLKKISENCQWSYSNSSKTTPSSKNFLSLREENKNMTLTLHWNQSSRIEKTYPNPFSSELMAERRPQYYAEMALAEMARSL